MATRAVQALSRSAGATATVARASARAFSTAEQQFPAYVLNAPATEVTELSNGVRVATQAGHGDTATVGVYIDAGSRHETAENNGAAHFLEHMNFKGTGKRSQRDIELEVENMGGHLNAYTSREQTVYYAKCFKGDVPKATDMLGDILLNSKYDPAAVERERDVILREMEEVNNVPEEVIFDYLHDTAYQGTGLARTILGPEENIRSLTRDHLEGFIKTHYTGDRIVISAAGAVDHDALVEQAEKSFGSLPATGDAALTTADSAVFTGSDVRVRDDDLPVGHVAIGFETEGWTSAHSFPLMVAQTLLGSWDRTTGAGANAASQLARKVGEGSLAHSFTAFHTCYKDTGLFGVYAVAPPTHVHELVYNIMNESVRLCHEVTDEEVERAKMQLKTTLLSQLDGSTAVCEDIGRQMLTYGRRMTPAELFARVDAVETDDVRTAARAFIDDKDVAVAAVGNVHELPDYNWLRRRTYWLRY